jgi:hypothetical protein
MFEVKTEVRTYATFYIGGDARDYAKKLSKMVLTGGKPVTVTCTDGRPTVAYLNGKKA